MAEKLTIQFKAVGAGALKKTIEDLHLANIKLTKGQAAFVRAQKRVQKTLKKGNKEWVHFHRNVGKAGGISSKFGIAMSSVRSKLLIYAFAVGLVATAMKKLFDRFIEQEKAEKKLEVALGETNQALLHQASALQQATAFGDEAIIGVQALIAAFTDDEEAIKSATKATLDLAAAKGMDLNAAADLVSKTLGSSTNSLSRYGVVVEGAVGSTARLNSLTENIADLFGGQAAAATETLGGSIQQMSNAFGDASEAVGKAFSPILMKLAPLLKEAAEATREWILGFAEDPLERVARRIEEAGGNADRLRLSMAKFAQIDLNAKVEQMPEFLNTSAEAIDKLEFKQGQYVNELKKQAEMERVLFNLGIDTNSMRNGSVFAVQLLIDELESSMDLHSGGVALAEQQSDFYQESVASSRDIREEKIEELKVLKKQMEVWQGIIEKADENVEASLEERKNYEDIVKFLLEYEAGLLTIEQLTARINGESEKTSQTLTEWIIANKETIDLITEAANQMSDIFGELASRAKEEAQETIDALNEIADAQISLIKENANNTIAEEKKKRSWQRMTAKQQADYEKKIMDEVAKNEAAINAQREKDAEKAKKKANQMLLIQFRIDQGIRIAEAVMNTATAYTKALPNIPLSVLVAGLGAVQIGLIASQKPPKMARGGYIGGRSHAEGGTMINAERGEFVMRKSAVDSLGLETLNRMNQGGGGGSINVSFTGNVLSDDFIEDEALPKIKEALRRGGDIGIG